MNRVRNSENEKHDSKVTLDIVSFTPLFLFLIFVCLLYILIAYPFLLSATLRLLASLPTSML